MRIAKWMVPLAAALVSGMVSAKADAAYYLRGSPRNGHPYVYWYGAIVPENMFKCWEHGDVVRLRIVPKGPTCDVATGDWIDWNVAPPIGNQIAHTNTVWVQGRRYSTAQEIRFRSRSYTDIGVFYSSTAEYIPNVGNFNNPLAGLSVPDYGVIVVTGRWKVQGTAVFVQSEWGSFAWAEAA
jgi:hypothetical protein